MTVTQEELKGVHARVGRLEDRVDATDGKVGTVAENVSFIRGYLEDRPEPGVPRFTRDVGMVAGGGGIVGAVLYVLERLFSSGAVP